MEREDEVAPPLLTHNSDPPQTYLWVSSLPTPQAVSSKQPMADLSLGLLPKPHVLAPSPRLHREPMSQAGAPGLEFGVAEGAGSRWLAMCAQMNLEWLLLAS